MASLLYSIFLIKEIVLAAPLRAEKKSYCHYINR